MTVMETRAGAGHVGAWKPLGNRGLVGLQRCPRTSLSTELHEHENAAWRYGCGAPGSLAAGHPAFKQCLTAADESRLIWFGGKTERPDSFRGVSAQPSSLTLCVNLPGRLHGSTRGRLCGWSEPKGSPLAQEMRLGGADREAPLPWSHGETRVCTRASAVSIEPRGTIQHIRVHGSAFHFRASDSKRSTCLFD